MSQKIISFFCIKMKAMQSLEGDNRLLWGNYKSTLNTSLQYRIITAPSSTIFDTKSNPDVIFKQIPLTGYLKNIYFCGVPVIKKRSDQSLLPNDAPLTLSDNLKCLVDRNEVIVNGLSVVNQSNLANYWSIKTQLNDEDKDYTLEKSVCFYSDGDVDVANNDQTEVL